MNSNLSNLFEKRALLIGAATEACLASARRLHREGADLAFFGSPSSTIWLEDGRPGDTCPPRFEIIEPIRDERELAGAFRRLPEVWDALDVLVIFEEPAPSACCSAVSEWNEPLECGLNWTLLAASHALPLLRSRGGSVIVVSSVHHTGNCENPGSTAYSYLRAARTALESCPARHIRLNVISPEAIPTYLECESFNNAICKSKTGDTSTRISKEIAEIVAFLASGNSRDVDGAEILVGQTDRPARRKNDPAKHFAHA